MTGAGAVVVPCIAAGSSVACFRSLGRKGIRTIGVSEVPNAPSSRSKYCHETQRVPSPKTDLDGYARALLTIAKRPDVATFVPLREADIYVLSKHREAFAEHVHAPWPGFDALEPVRDRSQLHERARQVGVPVPRTAPLDQWDGWDDVTVVKSRYSLVRDGGGSFYESPRFFRPETAPTASEIESLIADMGHVPMAQEYVPGDREHGFFALCVDGTPVVTFQHERVRSFRYYGGASAYRKSVNIPELEAAGSRLLRDLDWHGPAMVEFKHDPRDDEFKLMEINPRFWGSLPLACAAGVDFPYRYYQLAVGELERSTTPYDVGLGCHLVRGEVSYLASIVTDSYDHLDRPALLPEVWAVVKSMVEQPNFDFLDTDDPKPFVYDVLGGARDLLF